MKSYTDGVDTITVLRLEDGQLALSLYDALGDEVPGHEVGIITWGSHSGEQWLTIDNEIQWPFRHHCFFDLRDDAFAVALDGADGRARNPWNKSLHVPSSAGCI